MLLEIFFSTMKNRMNYSVNNLGLSTKKGRSIARLGDTPYYIYDKITEQNKINEETSFFTDALSTISKSEESSENKSKLNMTVDEVTDLYEKFINQYKYREDGLRKLKILANALKSGIRPNEDDLKEMFDETKFTIDGCIGPSVIIKPEYPDTFIPIPRTDGQRECIYVCGPSGSGKSYWTAMYLKEYLKIWPDRKAYLFSRKDYDPAFNNINNLNRIVINEEMIKCPEQFKYTEFADSLVIFDDIDTFEPIIKAFLMHIVNDLLEMGRQDNVSVIRMSHLLNKGIETKTILNEMNSIVIFPHGSSFYAIEYCLRNYLGLSKEQIKKIHSLPSRWVEIFKNYPMTVLYEKGIYLL